MSGLSDAVLDRFDLLTQRTFLVLDTEFCTDDGGNHLISLAVVPVIRGKRAPGKQEFHRVMNPGVPIDEETQKVHGFTDEAVHGKRRFDYYAPRIVKHLASYAEQDPVLVCHSGADIRLLREELERLRPQGSEVTETRNDAPGEPEPAAALQLPSMPLLDTSVLHRVVKLENLTRTTAVKLGALCGILGVTHEGAHDALYDARATADCLIAMLLVAAKETRGRHFHARLEDILAAHGAGTTHDPHVSYPGRQRRRGWVEPKLSEGHARRHARTDRSLLGPDPTIDDLAAWVATATECVQIRCPHLAPSAALVPVEHVASLWDPLWELATTATEPGQPATALGALMRLLDPQHGQAPDEDGLDALADDRVLNTTGGALTNRTAMPWWTKNKDAVANTPACQTSGSAACPDCRTGLGCPRDRFYEPIARISTFGATGNLDKANIKNRLFGRVGGSATPKRAYHDWTDPRCVAYMVWLVVIWTRTRDRDVTAAKYLAQAQSDERHLHDPRLALLVCESIAETSGLAAASAEVDRCLQHRTSDPAWDEISSWRTWRQHAEARTAAAAKKRTIRYPRMARPNGRAHRNPYLP